MIAADPYQGGATWAVLQYVLGLLDLGHDVFFVEPLPAAQATREPDWQTGRSANYFHAVIEQFQLGSRAALLLAGTSQTVGLPYEQLLEIAGRADVLLNISGMLTDERLLSPIPTRVYLDLDPAFIQCWHDQEIDMRFAAHNHFVTVGLALGSSACPVPTCGRNWITTCQPVVLSHWPVVSSAPRWGLTTVGNWRGYGSVEHQGMAYGQKAHSWRNFFTLPQRVKLACQPALAIHPGETADVAALQANAWQIVDPHSHTGTPDDYRKFIGDSTAELGIAKSGYVLSRSGWFSDRSACYLASGRPVIAQDTGFANYLPTGRGLLAFNTLDQVVAAVESVQADYGGHCRAAREIAEQHFDSRRVLPRLLQAVGADV